MAKLARIGVGIGALVAVVVLEARRPLRPRTQRRLVRSLGNVAFAAISAGALAIVQDRVVGRALRASQRRRAGLLRWLRLPPHLAAPLGFVLLDYTLWHWHWLLHRVPVLWRFHAAHHADLDLDASTALRFHAGELLASMPYRALQVALLGIDERTLRAWERAVFVGIVFHHSNVRLPRALDDALARFVVTPRMHGIHHSARPDRLDTNFGTLFAFWDDLHRTREAGLDQRSLDIGLRSLLNEPQLTLGEALLLPFLPSPPISK